jgi:diacylglycerol O-acyltransferase
MDRLSALDVSFLTNESSASHMHVGAIAIFEGPPPSYDDLAEHVSSRLHLVPRFRQKLAFPPAPTGRPFWVDDPSFNLTYHLRHSALPAPGSEDQLRRMAARIFSQQLDRTKPLWELWLVQGLTRKRFAFVTKTHHALVDGVSGVDIATVLFDLKPIPEPAEPEHEWVPEPEPSAATLLAKDAEGLLTSPLRLARRVERAV